MKGYLEKYENQWVVEYWSMDQTEGNISKSRSRNRVFLDPDDSMYCLDSDCGKEVDFDTYTNGDLIFAKLKKINDPIPDFNKKVKNKTYRPIKFELTEKEVKRYNKWKKKLPEIDQTKFGAAGGGYWFKFIPTGIGDVVLAGRSDVPELDINLTDYDSW